MARKQTSDRVSSLAARIRERFRGLPANTVLLIAGDTASVPDHGDRRGLSLRDLRSLANSCVGQDETKGRRTPAKRGASR